MKLLTKELLRTIPPLYSQENESYPICRAKFFMPDGAFTWYVIEGGTREKTGCGFGVGCQHQPLTEYDPDRDDVLFFGYVIGLEAELGYFTLKFFGNYLADIDPTHVGPGHRLDHIRGRRGFRKASLSELTAVRGMLGLPVERDRHFTPCRLSEITTGAQE